MSTRAKAVFVSCCLFLLFVSIAAAQQYRFINYARRDGLPNTRVKCLLQDKTGFIWIGTQDGLFRYDGYTFKAYYHNDNDSNSLVQNDINCLFQDSRDLIWIGTFSYGVSCLDPVSGKIRNYQNKRNDPHSIGPFRVAAITEDKNGNVWFATGAKESTLSKFDRSTNSFVRIRQEPEKSWNSSFSLALADNGMLYVGCHDSFGIFNPAKHQFVKSLGNGLARTLYLDEKQNLWIGYYEKDYIEQYDPVHKEYTKYHSPGAITDVNAFCEKSADELWIADLKSGLGIFNKKTGSVQFTQHEDAPYSIIEGNGANCLLKDRQGSLWIGFDQGLSRLDPRHQLFTWHDDIKSDDLRAEKYFEFSEFIKDSISGNIYASSGDGIFILKGGAAYTRLLNPMRKPDDQPVLDIFQDGKNNLWVIDWDYLFKMDRQSGKLIYTPLPMDLRVSGTPPMFTSLYEDRQSNIWIGTLRKGLIKYDPATGKTQQFTKQNRSDFKIDNYIRTGGEDKQGNIWFYSGEGICYYNSQRDTFTNFLPESENSFLKSCNGMVIDKKGRIWIGSLGKGLSYYSHATGKFERFTTSDGLCNDQVNDMIIGPLGNIWVATRNGLSYINPQTLKAISFFEDEGLHGPEVSGLSIIDGVLYVGQKGGYCTAPISSLKKNPWIPPVVITSFKVFGKEYPQKKGADPGGIKLSYRQNHFSFDFAALSFTSPEKNQYAYKLEGYDKNWINAGNRRYADYTYVPGGNYTFRVKASNNDGVWNEAGISIPLTVIPPFWETWWFRLLLAVSIPAVVFFFVNRRIRFIKRRAAEKLQLQKQLAALEMKALRAQMNPHFLFNALNSIQHQIITDDTKNAFTYLDKFGRLLRMILDNSERPLLRLRDELESLQLYIEIEALRFQNSFHYSIEIDPELDVENVFIPGMLLQPYIENAIWHGLLTKEGEPRLNINLSQSESILHCIIEDNGIGREKAKEQPRRHSYKSKGMQITEDRLNVIGQLGQKSASVHIIDLKDSKGEPAGTRVEIAIPLIEEHEKNYA